MNDYISRQAVIEAVHDEFDECLVYDKSGQEAANEVERILEAIPAADVRPVVRGRWLLDSDPGEPWKYKCDQCGEVTNNTCMGEPRYNYCPMCGADMREGDADGEGGS